MSKKINWQELTKLPAISTIFNNRDSLNVEDLDHLRLLHIQEEDKIKVAQAKLDKRKSGHLDYVDVFTIIEMRFSRVVDCETLEVVGESGLSGEADNLDMETVEDSGNSKRM